MKILRSGLFVIVGCFLLSTFHPAAGQTADSQAPTRYSLRTLGPYQSLRMGYDSLPVKVVGACGGKLGPDEKFKILVSMLKNDTAKNVKAVKFSFFIFKFGESDEELESKQTALFPINLSASKSQVVELVVGYADDIPLLLYKPGQQFAVEIAVTEVHYEDGSMWQGTTLPQKLDLAKPR